MPAASYDLTIEQGATFRLAMTYGRKTGQKDTSGADIIEAYDLTGCTARLQIRQRRDSDILLYATTENGRITVADPLNGRLVIEFDSSETDALAVKRARYDLEVQYPSGDVVRVLQGNVTISGNITRPAPSADFPTSFPGDEEYNPATVTTTGLTALPPSPIVEGAGVTLVALVSPAAPGAVAFMDGATRLGTGTDFGNGSYSLAATLPVGVHAITAVYTPADATKFATSTSTALSYTVTAYVPPTITATTLTATPSTTAPEGDPVTLTATVDPAAAGSIDINDETGGVISLIEGPVPVIAGVASTVVSDMLAGPFILRAVFTPADPNAYTASSSDPVTYEITVPGP